MPFRHAERARAAEQAGRFRQALRLYRQAIKLWSPGLAPIGENGCPELDWPAYWEGSCVTLAHVIERVGPVVLMVVMTLMGAGFVALAVAQSDQILASVVSVSVEQHFTVGHLAVIPI